MTHCTQSVANTMAPNGSLHVRLFVFSVELWRSNIKYLIEENRKGEASVFDQHFVGVYKTLGGFSTVNLFDTLSPFLLFLKVTLRSKTEKHNVLSQKPIFLGIKFIIDVGRCGREASHGSLGLPHG